MEAASGTALTNDSSWKEQRSDISGFDPFGLKVGRAFTPRRSEVPHTEGSF